MTESNDEAIVVALQQYGGAVSRVGPADTAVAHREAQYNLFPAAVWTDPTASGRHLSWVREA